MPIVEIMRKGEDATSHPTGVPWVDPQDEDLEERYKLLEQNLWSNVKHVWMKHMKLWNSKQDHSLDHLDLPGFVSPRLSWPNAMSVDDPESFQHKQLSDSSLFSSSTVSTYVSWARYHSHLFIVYLYHYPVYPIPDIPYCIPCCQNSANPILLTSPLELDPEGRYRPLYKAHFRTW